MENVKKSFFNIVSQAQTGEVKIGSENLGFWTYQVKFSSNLDNTKPENFDNYPYLKIANKQTFFKKLKTYVDKAKVFYSADQNYFDLEDQSFQDMIIFNLIINATFLDFEMFDNYVLKRIELINTPLPEKKVIIGEYLNNQITAEIRKNRSNLEAPYKMIFNFVDKDKNVYTPPAITFGIIDDTAYIYAVQNTIKKQDNQLSKKLDRHFRKLNKDIDPDDIIANVSPSAVVSITIFNTILKYNNINKIIAPCFLPIRYYTISDSLIKRYSKEDVQKEHAKHNKIQYNITNKFMYLFSRYVHHFNSSSGHYDPTSQEMFVTLKDSIPINDNIIYDIENAVRKKNSPLEK